MVAMAVPHLKARPPAHLKVTWRAELVECSLRLQVLAATTSTPTAPNDEEDALGANGAS